MLHPHQILVPAAIERLQLAVARGDAMAILRAARQIQAVVAGLAPGAGAAAALADCLAATRAAEAACAGVSPGGIGSGKVPSRTSALRAKTVYGKGRAGVRIDG